jgi:hypothetical protein
VPPEVVEADNRLLATEIRDLGPDYSGSVAAAAYPDLRIEPWPFAVAESQFLGRWAELGVNRGE